MHSHSPVIGLRGCNCESRKLDPICGMKSVSCALIGQYDQSGLDRSWIRQVWISAVQLVDGTEPRLEFNCTFM